MKTRVFFFMTCIWLLATNGFAQNTIKGDGNIITKEISISDYDEISYVGKVNIKYEQSNASPFFKITIDENILPHLDIKIKGKTLIIQPKNEKKYFIKFFYFFCHSYFVKCRTYKHCISCPAICISSTLRLLLICFC